MAPAEDSKIERSIRRIVRERVKNGEDVTVKRVRKQVEETLDLGDGFLMKGAWKGKSKEIVTAAFDEAEAGNQAVEAEMPNKGDEDAPKPQKKSKKSDQSVKATPTVSEEWASPAPKRPETTAPKVNGVKRKASTNESSSVSGSEGSSPSADEESNEPASKKAKVDQPAVSKGKAVSKVAVTGSDESSEDDGSGKETSTSESEEAEDGPSSKAAETAPSGSTRAIPSKTFKPPAGFTPVDSALLSKNTDLLNLEGKQIWHITAPSNVPISILSELALSSIASGDTVLTHRGIPYTLAEDKTTSPDATALLAPSKEGHVKAQQKVSRTLHLQQKIDLPNLSALQASQTTGSNAAGDIAQAPVSHARPQPKGLRMRYKPPGFGKGNPGRIGSGSESGDDEDASEEGPSFQFPKTLGQHGVEVKQTGDVEMVDVAKVEAEDDGKAKKKAKKKRKEKGSVEVVAEAPKVNGVSGVSSAEKSADGESLANGTQPEKESKEQRKRRKEEKRARKEGKTKTKATSA